MGDIINRLIVRVENWLGWLYCGDNCARSHQRDHHFAHFGYHFPPQQKPLGRMVGIVDVV